MVEAGYLVRHEDDKSYALGPPDRDRQRRAEAYPAASLVQEPMDRLSREFDLECVASTAIAGEIVILATSGTPRPLGINVQPGLRLPLVPPLGTVFVAWSGRGRSTAGSTASGPRRPRRGPRPLPPGLDVVRQRGFSVGLGGDEQQRLVESLQSSSGRRRAPSAPGEEYALVELADTAPHTLNHIGAPVFGPDGRVALALFLIGFRGQIPARDVPRYAERLVAEANAVTAGLHGIVPVV
jgi:DNA-binding IclR family transcriptional regulator